MTIAAQPPIVAPAEFRDDDHEQIVVRQDPATGLRLIVAVHSTVLGPALGGMRLKRYPGGLAEALDDVMRLARTMSLKASVAGLDLGGGKAVMIDDGRADLRERRLIQAAEVIESLNGAYITAEDIGTTTADMDHVSSFTRFCVGRSPENGGGGDPSPVTAETVFRAMLLGLAARDGAAELDGLRVGVIGLGKVGGALVEKLTGAGARVIACDLDRLRAQRVAAEHDGVELAPSADAIMAMKLDVLAPCAAGGLIDEAQARSLRARVIAGAANNPLTGRHVAGALSQRGILYVPDFLANCGGLIHVAREWQAGQSGPSEEELIGRAMEGLRRALDTAAREGSTPVEIAERQALDRIEAAR